MKKGAKVELIPNSDDGYGWSKVKSGDVTGWIMNSHLEAKGLSSFKTYTLKADKKAKPIKDKKLGAEVTLKKGTKYKSICEIESGTYKGKNYIGIGSKRYYI